MNQPHIILITADQMRADVLGGAGHPVCQTPALDTLAAQGVRYPNAMTPCPVCMPARHSILSGQYPTTHGTWSNHHAGPRGTCDLMSAFRAAGYQTALIGKNHTCLGPEDVDIFEANPASGLNAAIESRRAWNAALKADGHPRLADEPAAGGLAGDPDEARTTLALSLLDQWQPTDRPWLIWLSLHSPHTPYVTPEPFYSMYAEAELPPAAPIPSGDGDENFRLRFHRRNNDSALPFDAG